ncbi:MAG: M1 family metallopeptidase [Flavobacterium sp.]
MFKKIQFISFFCIYLSYAQPFTEKDSLHGGLRKERNCFDVLRYDLSLEVFPDEKRIAGFNQITFKTVDFTNKIQLDLFENMNIDSIVFENKKLNYTRRYNAVFIDFTHVLQKHKTYQLQFYYNGTPIEAKNAPWDGGFVWKKDSFGKPFIGVAVQGIGASLWYPVKDHQSDEPDLGASIKVIVPAGLINVSNGLFVAREDLENDKKSYKWEVKNPINNYNIVLNIGDYVNIEDQFNDLKINYYVLRENEVKARKHFEEVKPMLECFESKFGTYPFKEDSFKLVETPYLGMEHQSAIAYGNKYLKGYLGDDMTGTGIGMLFDLITIHETAHEWFGNSITSKDIADMWIHESFATYAESVFIECRYGYDKAQQYINGQKKLITNEKPVVGQFGVNFKTGNSDMYYKGTLIINTIRHIINDDVKWWRLLKNFSIHFKHKIIEKNDVISFFNQELGMDLTPIFDHYLLKKDLPILEILKSKKYINYRWKNVDKNFKMPIEITLLNGKSLRIVPESNWQKIKENQVIVSTNKFLIDIQQNE